MIEDPYKVLGLEQDASPDDVKKAYRKMAKLYHPDLHPNDPDIHDKMNAVNEAYDMLTNPAKYTVKKAQEEWVNNQNDQLREIRENIDEEDAMAAVTAAENIMLYYRSRAIDLCVILYEIEGQIAFG